MWIAILGISFILTLAGLLYLASRFGRFGIVRKLAGDRTWLRRLLGAIPLVGFVVWGVFDLINAMIVLLHLSLFWLIGDGIAALVSHRRKSRPTPRFRVYWTGVAVMLLCGVYLTVGWHQAFHVSRTAYQLTTTKPLPGGRLRVALIADSHIGTTFDGEGLGEHLARMQQEQPDLLVVTGDFVDDATTREEMVAACEALGEVDTTYGTFFVYGNHDKGYYSRSYSPAELETALITNGITVLEDEVVSVGDCFYIIGRKDRSEAQRNGAAGDRMSIEQLTASLDQNRYMLVLNHQPNDYAAEAAAGVDLVLSGHTHGGQLIPLGPIGRLIGANDRTYGLETRGNTDFVVTSGISDWAIHFKTGATSEYVILDISQI